MVLRQGTVLVWKPWSRYLEAIEIRARLHMCPRWSTATLFTPEGKLGAAVSPSWERPPMQSGHPSRGTLQLKWEQLSSVIKKTLPSLWNRFIFQLFNNPKEKPVIYPAAVLYWKCDEDPNCYSSGGTFSDLTGSTRDSTVICFFYVPAAGALSKIKSTPVTFPHSTLNRILKPSTNFVVWSLLVLL